MAYVFDELKGDLFHSHKYTDIIGGTSTQVPYFGADGKLTSGAEFDYDGNSVRNIGATSGANRGFFAQNTDSSGQGFIGFRGDQGADGFVNMLYGGSANALGTIFGLTRANRAFIFAQGSTNLGLAIGTTSGQPLIFGTNNAEVARFISTGQFGIGTTSPTAVLHLKAGTATANTAPLKFTSGTLNTTAEAGAVEFLSNRFYLRNSKLSLGGTGTDGALDVTAPATSGALGYMAKFRGTNGYVEFRDDDRTGFDRVLMLINNTVLSTDFPVFSSIIGTETFARFAFWGDGALGWGTGVATWDTFLQRTAANTLTLDSDREGGAANLIIEGGFRVNGSMRFGTHSAIATETITGYITITDAAGNARKLAVVS